MIENTTEDGGNIVQGSPRWVDDRRVRAPPDRNSVVGEPSPSSQPPPHQGSSETCGQSKGGGWGRDDAACRRGGRLSGNLEGSSALPKGQRQRLLRSDSDRAILGRVDYKAVKRDLR